MVGWLVGAVHEGPGPQISYASTAVALSNLSAAPTFFRTVPSDAFQGAALAQLVLFFFPYCRQVGVVYTDDVYGAGLALSFGPPPAVWQDRAIRAPPDAANAMEQFVIPGNGQTIVCESPSSWTPRRPGVWVAGVPVLPIRHDGPHRPSAQHRPGSRRRGPSAAPQPSASGWWWRPASPWAAQDGAPGGHRRWGQHRPTGVHCALVHTGWLHFSSHGRGEREPGWPLTLRWLHTFVCTALFFFLSCGHFGLYLQTCQMTNSWNGGRGLFFMLLPALRLLHRMTTDRAAPLFGAVCLHRVATCTLQCDG